MGYRTYFYVTKPEDLELRGRIVDEINLILGYNLLDPDGCPDGDATWYDWREDMCKVSRKFPGTHITLRGAGEDNDDQWECHFQDGKYHHCPCKITFPKFNPKKLKEPD